MRQVYGKRVFAVAGVLSVLGTWPACSTKDSTTGPSGVGGQLPETTLALPQFVRGAAWVDTQLQSTIPLVVEVTGPLPDSVEVLLDGVSTNATLDGGRYLATLSVGALTAGTHELVARAAVGGSAVAQAQGTIVGGAGSRQLTSFTEDGTALSGQLVLDREADAFSFAWRGKFGSTHGYWLRNLDGAFRKLTEADRLLSAPEDDVLDGAAVFGPAGVGVVYRTAQPNGLHWEVKLHALGRNGVENVPLLNLTAGEAAFSVVAAGADPKGFSAAWIHLRDAVDGVTQPAELRYARYDVSAKKLIGPLTLDLDSAAPVGSLDGPLTLEPLGELSVACNESVCLVSYSRKVYNSFVLLNIPKVFVASIDQKTGKATSPVGVSLQDWDTQLFGQQLVALPDGSFALIYTATDTHAAVTPKSPCDVTYERDLLHLVRFDAKGAQLGKASVLFDHEGTRQFPRLTPHPSGFAMFWEDQRSYCESDSGHIRMAASFLDSQGVLGEYRELPNSIGIPSERPMVTTVATNAQVLWSDNRHGAGLFDLKLELYADTVWSK